VYNRLFHYQMKHVENLWNVAASTQNHTEDGVIPFSVQEYTCILCQLFVTWRCRPPGSDSLGCENSTHGQSPIVWMAWKSRIRCDPGMTVRVELPDHLLKKILQIVPAERTCFLFMTTIIFLVLFGHLGELLDPVALKQQWQSSH
jgi:hypothetical protein